MAVKARKSKTRNIFRAKKLRNKLSGLVVIFLVGSIGLYTLHLVLGTSQYAFQANFDTLHPLNVGTYKCGNESAHVFLDSDIWCEAQVDIVNQGGSRGRVARNYVVSGQTTHQGMIINILPVGLDGWLHELVKIPKAPPAGSQALSFWGIRWSSDTQPGGQTENVVTLNSDMRLSVIGNHTPGFSVPLNTWVSIRVHVTYGNPATITLIAAGLNGTPLSGASGGKMIGSAATSGRFGPPGRIKFGQGGEILNDSNYVGFEYFYDNLYVSNGSTDPGPWTGGSSSSPPAPTSSHTLPSSPGGPSSSKKSSKSKSQLQQLAAQNSNLENTIHHSSWLKLLIFGALLAVVTGIGGYFGFKKYKSRFTNNQPPASGLS